jgi:hypothetical protein
MAIADAVRVGIIQSNYIPWKGYFDIIHDVDLFVFHDDLQYTKGDWRNRNRIKTPQGECWLTIPVGTSEHRRICDVPLPGSDWARDHWRQIESSYHRARFFDVYRDYFEGIYLGTRWRWLSELNQSLITGIARDLLGITTAFTDSTSMGLARTKGDRVLEIPSTAPAPLLMYPVRPRATTSPTISSPPPASRSPGRTIRAIPPTVSSSALLASRDDSRPLVPHGTARTLAHLGLAR